MGVEQSKELQYRGGYMGSGMTQREYEQGQVEYRKKMERAEQARQKKMERERRADKGAVLSEDDARKVQEQLEGVTGIMRFKYTELVRATDYFSNKNKIGEGMSGEVYSGKLALPGHSCEAQDSSGGSLGSSGSLSLERGSLPAAEPQARKFKWADLVLLAPSDNEAVEEGALESGSGRGAVGKSRSVRHRVKVAVKRLKGADIMTSVTEAALLAQIPHPRLVKLYGYTFEDGTFLVYERMEGNLDEELHKSNTGACLMTWPERLQIALDVIEALQFLYSRNFIHRDIKATNILLTGDKRAKLTDFGFAKKGPVAKSVVTTRVMGSKAYIDPDYATSGKLGPKSDLFAYGVILFELITGKRVADWGERVVDDMHAQADGSEQRLEETCDAFVDPKLKDAQGRYSPLQVQEMAKIAWRCTQKERKNRPTVTSVSSAVAHIIAGHKAQLEGGRAREGQKEEEEGRKEFGEEDEEEEEEGEGEGSRKKGSLSTIEEEAEQERIRNLVQAANAELAQLKAGSSSNGKLPAGKLAAGPGSSGSQSKKEAAQAVASADAKQPSVPKATHLGSYTRKTDEARALEGFSHPRVVFREPESGRAGSTGATTLGAALARQADTGTLGVKWDQRVRIALDVASALESLHSRGIVHRIVHGGNVLLAQDGCILCTPQHDVEYSAEAQAYMDPTRDGPGNLDAQSDVYSFGMVLFELVTGRRVATEGSQLRDQMHTRLGPKEKQGLPCDDYVDPTLPQDEGSYAPLQVVLIAILGWACTQSDRGLRPPIQDLKCAIELVSNDGKAGAAERKDTRNGHE